MSERDDAPPHSARRRDPPSTAANARRPRGRLRIIGPDGAPVESASPQALRLWQLADEGFWRYDLVTGDLDVTPALQGMLTSVIDTDTSREWSDVLHPDDRASTNQEVGALAVTPGAERTFVCRIRNKDGSYRWMRVRATAEFEAGKCIAFLGSARDVTERHRSEGIFEQMVQQHALILNAAGEGICCLDQQGRITFANPAAARLIGSSVPEILGQPLCRYMTSCGYDGRHEGAHAPDCKVVRATPASDAGAQTADRFERRDGSSFAAELTLSPITGEGGPGQGAVVVFNDVTHKKMHERDVQDTRERMAEAEKLAALGTLVSGVGHELRTPMSYINNHLYLMQRLAERMVVEDPDMQEIGAELARRCEVSMKGIARMSALLDDLRETYKPEDAEFRMLDVRDVVDKAVHLYRGAYEGPVQLETHLGDTGLSPVQSGRLQQVVINLLNNAAEAMPEGGTIHLTTSRKGDQVIVEVRDDGPGMTQEIERSIFQPFYTTKKSGSGLGLYLVKQIIDRHMGRIECDTELGRGTTFRIELSPDAGRPAQRSRKVAEIAEQLRQGPARQDATVDASTPIPSTSSSTSSPGAR